MMCLWTYSAIRNARQVLRVGKSKGSHKRDSGKELHFEKPRADLSLVGIGSIKEYQQKKQLDTENTSPSVVERRDVRASREDRGCATALYLVPQAQKQSTMFSPQRSD